MIYQSAPAKISEKVRVRKEKKTPPASPRIALRKRVHSQRRAANRVARSGDKSASDDDKKREPEKNFFEARPTYPRTKKS